MTDVAILRTVLDADPSRVDAVLARVQRELEQLGLTGTRAGKAAGDGLGQGIGAGADKAAAAQAKAEKAAISHAQALARLKAAQGDVTGAIETLSRALDGVDESSAAAIRGQTQLAQLQNRLAREAKAAAQALEDQARAQEEAKRAGDGLKGAIGDVAGELTGLSLGIGSALGLLAGMGAAMDDGARRAQAITLALGEMDPAQLDQVNAAAATLSARFGADLNLQVDTARVLMQAFGTDGAGAMDIIAAGFANGLNVSDDLLDTLKEYGPQFAALGFTAEETLAIIQRGLQNGARDTDYIGDAIKEFGIKLREAGTADAVAPLSAGLAQIVQDFQAGRISGEEAFAAITAGLQQIGDESLRQQAGVALFGPKFEDLGATAVIAMGQVDQSLIATAGATQQLNGQLTSLGEIGPRAFAALGSFLQPVNDGLLNLINTTMAGAAAMQGQATAADATNQQAAASAATYEEYLAKIAAANEEAVAANEANAQSIQLIVNALGPAGPAFLAAAEQMGLMAAVAEPMSEAQFLAAQAAEVAAQAAAAQAAILQEATAAAQDHTAATVEEERATRNAAVATDDASAAAAQSVLERLNQEAAALTAAQAEDDLMRAIGAVAGMDGDISASVAAIVKAHGLEESEVYALIRAYQELEQAKRASGSGGAAAAAGVGARGLRGPGTSARNEAVGVPGRPGRRGGRGGGGGGGGKTDEEREAERKAKADEREAERAAAAQEQLTEKLVDLELDRQEKLLAIAEEYAKKRADAQKSFDQEKLEGAYGFYRALLDIEDNALREQASREYEAAKVAAEQIAKDKGADVAAEWLAEQAEIIRERTKRQEEINAAMADGNTALAEYLRGLDAMARQAEEARLAEIASGEGSLNSQQAADEQAANDAAAKRQQELLGGAQELGAAERERLATLAAQTLELQRQAELTGKLGGSSPTVPAEGGPPAPAAVAAPAPDPAAAAAALGGPIEVTSAQLATAIGALAESIAGLGDEVGAGAQAQAAATARMASELTRQIVGAQRSPTATTGL